MTHHTVSRRVRRLEQRPAPRRANHRSRWDPSCFTDEELEVMVALAEKAESMAAVGQVVAWTVAEIALFQQLEQAYWGRCPSAA